ncbi:MAG TPA: hypothetical protein VEI03_17725 [Stellaceae bacterium]|nr:hypothetical protein [Stellaceae bacterium]
MSEPEIKRVIIACGAHGDIDIAVRGAAELAGRWRVPLHGLFLKDENLLRLAMLPFIRQVSLSAPELSGTLEVEQLQSLLSALAASMRRAIESAAQHAGVDWSFAELHDLPSAASGAVLEGDILVIDAGARAFSGSWRPRSLWESAAGDLGTLVLLRRNEGEGRPCIVLMLDGGAADHDRILGAVRALASPQDRLHVLAFGDLAADADFREALLRQFELAGLSHVAVERPARDVAEARDRVARLAPRLVAIETSALEQEDVQTLVANTQCDLLLVGEV